MADLNAIVHGIDSDSGEYLTSEQRKALFKKGKMKSPINTKAIRSGMITVSRSDAFKPGALARSSALVKQSKAEEKSEQTEFETDEVQTVFNQTKFTFVNILKVKREKENLRNKYFKLLGKKKPTPVPEESEEVSPKRSGGMRLKAPNFNLMGFLGDIIQFAIFDWISKPENKKIVDTFVKVFRVVAGFFNWFITGVVDNILTGFGELVGGDSIIERIGGFFKFAVGLVGLRWLLNPLKIFKDIGRVTKIIKSFAKMFKNTFAKGAKGMTKTFTNILSLAGKTFKKTFGRLIKRFFLKLFGKTITKGIKKLGKIALKRGVGLVRRFPLIGPIIAFGIELAMGEPVGRAAFKAIGATLLAGLGGIIGSIVPFAGTAIGAIVGGVAGEWAGGAMYDLFFKGKEKGKGSDTPEMETGGIASGPKNGYLVMLHGTEVVIPINKLADILILPFQTLGAGIIGAMMGSVNSMGSAGTFIRPIMVSVLGPLLKVFGSEKYTVTDKVGKTQGSADTLTRHIERETEERDLDKFFEKDILKELGSALLMTGGNIFNSIMGGSAQAKSSDPSSKRPATGPNAGNASPTSGDTKEEIGPVAPAVTGSNAEKYKQFYDMAVNAGARYPELVAAQFALESGYGTALAAQHNYFGIKAAPGESATTSNTREVINGKSVYVDAGFKNFATPQDAVNHLVTQWHKDYKGYRGVNNASSAEEAADMLRSEGYATDPIYAKKLKQIMRQNASVINQNGGNVTSTPAPATTTPSPLTPEQKSSMFQKSGMSALSANILSSVSTGVEREPDTSGAKMLTGTNKGPVPPVTPQATILKNTQTSSMIPMSTNFSIDRKVKQSRSLSATTFIMNSQTSNSMNVQTAPLNSTSIGESILLNRI